jgi:uncharacterized protein (TIGR02147 family)
VEISNDTFIEHLKWTLEDRIKSNSNYSLRAFAKSLNVEASSLSQILRKKRPLSSKMKLRLMKGLDLNEEVLKTIFEKVNAHKGDARTSLSLDAFKVISDWQHFAILELIRTKNFKPDIRWIASKLGINYLEVQAAVDRLQNLDFLVIDASGEWIDQIDCSEIYAHEFTSIAQKHLQKQILKKAVDAIDEVPLKERVQSSMTLAIPKSKVESARKRIRSFLAEMEKELQAEGEEMDSVYHLTTALYPVTKD